MYYELLTGGVIGITCFSLTISVPLYVLVLIAIRSNRDVYPFNSEFYVIFVSLGIVDLICYFLFLIKKLIFLGLVPAFLTPFNQPNEYACYLYYPFWVFAFLQYQLTFILTLNRHFSIVLPCHYVQMWSSRCTRWLICLSFFVSCLLALPILKAKCQISEYIAFRNESSRTLRYGPYTISPEIDKYMKNLWAFHVYGLIISSVVFYSLMIRKLQKTRTLVNSKRRKIEMQMFYAGFALFVLNLAFTVYFLLRDMLLVRITTNPHVHEWILYFLADIYDLPNGYIIWSTSKKVRQVVYDLLGLKSNDTMFSFLNRTHTSRVSAITNGILMATRSVSSTRF